MNNRVVDFYVATNGDDQWSGKLEQPAADGTDGPFASLGKAQFAVRELKKSNPDISRPIRVYIRTGTYYLDEPLCFRPEDSGRADAAVIYEAYPGEKPVISGGIPITGWSNTDDGWLQVHLPDVEKGDWNFTQLFVNDHRCYRPRLPREKYYFFADEIPPGKEAEGKGCDRFKFSNNDLRDDWYNLGDVEVLCFHFWEMSRMRLKDVDTRQKIATLTGHTCSPKYFGSFFKGNRFLVENVREALGDPGGWYLDRTSGVLTYIPRPEEDTDTIEVIAPRLNQLLLLEGNVENRSWVQYVHFKGLTFAHTNWTTPPRGHSDPQGEISLGAAIYGEATRHCQFVDCTIKHVGEHGVQWSKGCRYNLIEGCDILDLGAGGVKIGETYKPNEPYRDEDEEALCSNNTVRDCRIAHAGRMHPGAVGIWIGHSPYNVIEHNEITDIYYSAISVGWMWSYEKSHAHHNIIAFNHIHHICQGILDDMGACYLLGVSPGTVIRGNHMHDIMAFHYGGGGIYLDQGASDIIVTDNVCYRCNGQPFHQHYGRDNHIINNIFAMGGASQIGRTRQEDHCSFVFERNLVYWDNNSALFDKCLSKCEHPENGMKMDYNLYYNAGGFAVRFNEDTLEQWQSRGCDRHSIIADPLFKDPDNGGFRMEPDSPAEKTGFQPIDISQAGRLKRGDQCPITGIENPAFPVGFTADDFEQNLEVEVNAAGVSKQPQNQQE